MNRILQQHMTDLGLALAAAPDAGTWQKFLLQLERTFADQEQQVAQAASAAARASEAKFRAKLALSPDWHWETDAKGRYTAITAPLTPDRDVNPAQLIGLGDRSLDQLIGAQRIQLWPEPSTFARLIAQTKPLRDGRFKWVFADGRERYMAVNFDPVFDAHGEFQGYRGITRDISAEVAAAADLRRSQQHLERALVASETSAVEVDLRTNVARFYCPPTAGASASVSLVTLDAMLALTCPETQAQLRALWAEARNGLRRELDFDYLALGIEGAGQWRRLRGEVVEHDPVTGLGLRFVGATADITQSKLAAAALEQKAHDASMALRLSQTLLDLRAMDLANVDDLVRAATTAAALALQTERVAVWRFTEERDAIVCVDTYTLSSDRHEAGRHVQTSRLSQHLTAIAQDQVLAIRNMGTDPRWDDEVRQRLIEQGVVSTLDCAIGTGDHAHGVLGFRHHGAPRIWTEAEKGFAHALSDILVSAFIDDTRRRNDQRFQTLFDALPDRAWLKDPQGRYLAINRSEAQAYGVEKEAILGRKRSELRPGPGAQAAEAEDQRVMASGQLLNSERPDHLTGAWSEITKVPVRSADGQFLGLACIARDLSQTKRAELALTQAKQRLDLALEAANTFVIEFNFDDDVATVHGAKRFGGRGTSAQMSADTLIEEVHPDDQPMVRKLIWNLRRGTDQAVDANHRMRAPDGSWRWCRLVGQVHDSDASTGSSGRFFGAIVDVHERRLANTALASARDAALRASQNKSEFLANMSHELRNPMNGVLGLAELALEREKDPIQREYLQHIEMAGQTLMALVNGILDLSKIEAGKLEIEVIKFTPRTMLDQVVALTKVAARSKQIDFRLEVDPALPPSLMGDPVRISQVLNNLCGNAVKFTQAGSVVLGVRVHQSPASGSVAAPVSLEFTVQDSGIGLSAEQLDGLFQPFSQADSSTTRHYGGTGLGLSISRQLVELMGGQISVRSQLGQGSTFCFTVPCAPLPASNPAPASAS